jgi:hypothetical protein
VGISPAGTRRLPTVLIGIALVALGAACAVPHRSAGTAAGASPAGAGVGAGSDDSQVASAAGGAIDDAGSIQGAGGDGGSGGSGGSGGGNQPGIADPIGSARVGNCFNAQISGTRVDLTPIACGGGTYQLIARYDNVTSASQCSGLANTDYTVTYPDRKLTFCLMYHYGDDQAAHAQLGTCIGQPSGSESWFSYSCQPGTFKVLGRFHGSTDTGQCGTSAYFNFSVNTAVPGNGAANLLLCLSYQFGSDAGYARVGNCMIRNGTSTSFTLSFPSGTSCDGTNVVITGRDNKFTDTSAKAFCGNDGYLGQAVTRYPKLSFTVCWRFR